MKQYKIIKVIEQIKLEFSKKILEINKNRLNDLLKEFK